MNGTTTNAPIATAPAIDSAISVGAIDHVNLSVTNLARSMDFYESVFGFRLAEDGRGRTDAPYVIMTAEGRAFLALHASARTARPSGPVINHWGFVVGDLDRVKSKLEHHGLRIQGEDSGTGGVRHWAHSRSLYISDPDGHEIELVEVFGGGLGVGG